MRLNRDNRRGLGMREEAGVLYPAEWVGERRWGAWVDLSLAAWHHVNRVKSANGRPPEPQSKKLFEFLRYNGSDYGMKPLIDTRGLVLDIAMRYGARRPRSGSVLRVVQCMMAEAAEVERDRKRRHVKPFYLPDYATMPRLTLRK